VRAGDRREDQVRRRLFDGGPERDVLQRLLGAHPLERVCSFWVRWRTLRGRTGAVA